MNNTAEMNEYLRLFSASNPNYKILNVSASENTAGWFLQIAYQFEM